jgi:hypothetical protein
MTLKSPLADHSDHLNILRITAHLLNTPFTPQVHICRGGGDARFAPNVHDPVRHSGEGRSTAEGKGGLHGQEGTHALIMSRVDIAVVHSLVQSYSIVQYYYSIV